MTYQTTIWMYRRHYDFRSTAQIFEIAMQHEHARYQRTRESGGGIIPSPKSGETYPPCPPAPTPMQYLHIKFNNKSHSKSTSLPVHDIIIVNFFICPESVEPRLKAIYSYRLKLFLADCSMFVFIGLRISLPSRLIRLLTLTGAVLR